MVNGSGARKIEGNTDMPIDCAIAAKVENINIDPKYNSLL
jgi:microcompartment protein CcmK/EutM